LQQAQESSTKVPPTAKAAKGAANLNLSVRQRIVATADINRLIAQHGDTQQQQLQPQQQPEQQQQHQ